MVRAKFVNKTLRAALVGCLIAASSAALAVTDTWLGASGTGWNTPANWTTTNPGGIPVNADTLLYNGATGGTSNNDTSTVTSLGGITFATGAGGYTLTSPSALALTGALTDNTANGTAESINLAINGASTSSLVFGSDLSGGNSVTLGATDTFGQLTVSSDSATANTLNIGANTLNITGALSIGSSGAVANAVININGSGGTLNMTNTASDFLMGGSTAATLTPTLNMSGLSNFVYSTGAAGTGNFRIGFNSACAATLTLASTSNTITAVNFSVGDSNGKNGRTTTLHFNGTTTVNAGTFTFGASKGTGNADFLAGTPVGSTAAPALKIRAQNGSGRPNITIGTGSSGTASGTGTVNLTGHYIDVLANGLTLGNHTGNIVAGNTGNFSFDDGVVDATTVTIANATQATGGATGTLTIGSTGNANTGTLIVGTGGLILGSCSNATGSATATLDVRTGGVVQAGTKDIAKGTTTGTVTATIILEGGTLDLQTHAIGSGAAQINTFTMPVTGQAATIQNLGGAGINASGGTGASNGGVAMGGMGTLILAGANSYTGNTTVSSGTVLVNGTLTASAPTVGGGTLGGGGTISGLMTVNGGALTGGSGATPTLTLANGLAMNGGNLLFNFGSTANNSINVSGGAVTFGGVGFNFTLSGSATPGTYTVLTSASPFSAGGLSFAPTSIGRTTFTPVSLAGTSTVLQVSVSGNPASLTWNNSVGGGDGSTWDSTQLNWTSSASNNPNQYFDGDNVAFSDSNNFPTNQNAYNVNVGTNVNPGSVTFNTTQTYTLTGGGSIGGTGGLSVSGGGTVDLSGLSNNSYTGNTTVSGGSTLVVSKLDNGGNSGSIGAASTNVILDGSTLKWVGNASQTTNRGITITQNGATLNASPTASGQGIIISGPITMTGSGARTLTLTGTDASLANQEIVGAITDGAGGATSIIKNGNNGWEFGGANSYSGGTTVNAGRIRLTTGGTLGSGNVLVANGAQVYFNAGTATFGNNFSVAGTGVDANGALRLGSNGTTLSGGTITLTGDTQITAFGATTLNGTTTIADQITQVAGTPLNLQLGNGGGSGTAGNTITLSNVTNNWQGNTTIGFGIVRAGASSGATNGVIPHGAGFGDVFISSNTGNNLSATFDLFGTNVTINGLNSGGSVAQDIITNGSGTAASTAASTLTIGDNGAGGTFDGTIQDGTKTLAIAKIGDGTEVFTGSNTYTGGTTVSGGTLQLGSGAGSALGANTGSLTVNTGGTLDLNGNGITVGALSGTGGIITSSTAGSLTLNLTNATNSNFAGSIQDGSATVGLTLGGTAAQTLSGTNTYSGDTNVNSSALVVNGSLKSTGNVFLNGNSTLSGSGFVGNVTVQSSGATIVPHSLAGTTATLSMASLTNNGGTLQFNLSSGNVSDKVVVNGTANFNSPWNISVRPTVSGGVGLPQGTFTLLAATTLNAGQPGSSSGTLPTLVATVGRQSVNLDYTTANTIKLDVGAFSPATLTWNNSQANAGGGSGDGTTWDVQNNQNWTSTATFGNKNQFYNGDSVIFNDNNNSANNGSAYNVQLNTTVTPGSVTVNNTAGNYTISGSGVIAGNGSLTKQGSGVLNLANSGLNTYSGSTAIQNGTLQLGATGALPIGTALSFGNGSGTTASTLDLGGNDATVSSIVENGGTDTIGNSGGSTATLTYAGSGASTFSGTLRDGLGAGGSQLALTVASGSLTLTAPLAYTGATTLGTGAQLQITGAFTESLSGTVSGGGNLVVGDGSTATVLTLSPNNAYTGVTTISNHSVVTTTTLANGGVASGIGASAVASSNLVLDGGTLQWTPATTGVTTNRGFTITANGATLDVSPTAGGVNTTISGAITESGTGSRTLTLTGTDLTPLAIAGQTLSGSLADPVGGQLSIVKTGSSGWILSGTNSYTGNVTILAGRIRAGSTSAFGNGGLVTVANGATAYIPTAGTFNNNFNIAGIGISETGTAVANNYGSLRLAANGTIIGGTVTLTGDARITGRSATGSGAVINGKITQVAGTPLNLEFGNSAAVGVLTVSNTANNWAGNTIISLGTLKAGASSTATSGVIPHEAGFGNVVMNGGDANSDTGLSTFDLNGFNVTINGLSSTVGSTGTMSQNVISNSGATAATLTVGDNNAGGTFGGIIQSGTSAVNLAKIGSATQTLTGVNTYTGATTVGNGTLALGVANAIATTPTVTLGDANSTSGTLNTGGFSQAMTATLALAKNSTLDLGLGGQPGTGNVNFLASNGLWGSSTLTIKDWTPGIDHLFFGASSSGLDPSQVSDITFANFGAAQITASGEIVPVAAVPSFVLGDVNGDGHFTVADISAEMAALSNISAFENNYGPSHLLLNTDELYAVLDQNHDGVINNADIQAAINTLANTGGNGNLTAVPEPASLLLLGLGAAIMLAARARRNTKNSGDR